MYIFTFFFNTWSYGEGVLTHVTGDNLNSISKCTFFFFFLVLLNGADVLTHGIAVHQEDAEGGAGVVFQAQEERLNAVQVLRILKRKIKKPI